MTQQEYRNHYINNNFTPILEDRDLALTFNKNGDAARFDVNNVRCAVRYYKNNWTLNFNHKNNSASSLVAALDEYRDRMVGPSDYKVPEPDDLADMLDAMLESGDDSITATNKNYPAMVMDGERQYTEKYLCDITQPQRLDTVLNTVGIDTNVRATPEYEINIPSESGQARIDIACFNSTTSTFTIIEAMSKTGKCDELHFSKTLFTYPRIIAATTKATTINKVLIASCFTEEQISFAKTLPNTYLIEAYQEDIDSEIVYTRIV